MYNKEMEQERNFVKTLLKDQSSTIAVTPQELSDIQAACLSLGDLLTGHVNVIKPDCINEITKLYNVNPRWVTIYDLKGLRAFQIEDPVEEKVEF